MMPSPYSVYEELKTKSDEEVIKEIKKFKREISQLKKAIELPIIDILLTRPSPETQILCIHEYIDEAKRLLRERGVEYKPTKAEQRALEFNEKLAELDEIFIVRDGFFKGRKQYLISCEEQYQTVIYTNRSAVDNIPFGWVIAKDKQSFIAELEKLYIGEWKSNYYMEALDGEQWKIEFDFCDGTKRTFNGSNAYPYNFNALMCFLGIGRENIDDERDSSQLPTEEEFAKLPEEEQKKVLEEWFDSLTPYEQQAYLNSLIDLPKEKKE